MFSRKNRTIQVAFSLRLAIIYTVTLCISLAALFSVTYQLVYRVVENRDHKVIEAQVAQFKALFERGGVSAIKDYFSQKQVMASPDQYFVRIVDNRNQVQFTVAHQLWDMLDEKAHILQKSTIHKQRWIELTLEETSDNWVIGMTPLSSDIYLQVGRNNTESHLVLKHFKETAMRILLPAAILSLIVGWLMTRSALSPLRALIDTVRHTLATGDLKNRVSVRAPRGELGALTSMFNRMLDRNEKLINDSRETLDNVAHDLRTPMTHLRNSAEQALQLPKTDPIALQDALADCVEESEQIIHMLNAIMDLSEATTGSMKLNLEPVEMRELVEEVIELYELLAEERGITITNNISDDCTVTADRVRLRQCLANLIDNALKYSSDNSSVLLFDDSTDDFTELSVQDYGCGIDKDDIPRIWDRLYRAEHSRSTAGLGLGLSLVRAIIEAHNGTVAVESELNEGSIFTIRLPKKLTC